MPFGIADNEPTPGENETWDEYMARRAAWRVEHEKTEDIKMKKDILARRWILAFLCVSIVFCLCLTPWNRLVDTNPKIYVFTGYHPLFIPEMLHSNQWGNVDLRTIDYLRLILWEVVFAMGTCAGYLIQTMIDNKK